MALTRKGEAVVEYSVPELNEANEPPSTVGAEEDVDGLVVLENHRSFDCQQSFWVLMTIDSTPRIIPLIPSPTMLKPMKE